ncbi:MAG TPA: response regulator transcription factor [Anaerolineales bacterium]|nr:response regulator transcription factor [Anaerolineales bacterium]
MSTINILLIGDEPNILRTLRRNLVSRGYEVLIALDDQEAAHILSNNDISLFVLNLHFETIEVDGLVILQEIREQNQAPIIVLSPIGTENLKIKAFDLGADDYLVLPFGMGEFLARTRSAIRRWSAQQAGLTDGNKVIVSGDLMIDIEARQVQVRGELIHLTPTEYDLLNYLAQNKGKVITHRELLQEIWGPEYGDEREYLRVFISQVRKKIEQDPVRPKFILTEPGVGYRFSIGQ